MLILVFVLTILLAAIAVLLWCLRGFTRTLKQQGFVGVLVRAEDGNPGDPTQQELAEFESTGVAAKSPDSQPDKGILRTRLGLTGPAVKIETHTSATLESRYRSRSIEDVA
jgi:hypothetical protein